MGSTPTTGTDITPKKAQSFLGAFLFGTATGSEQGGTAKPRTQLSSGELRSPRETPTTGTDIIPQKAQSFLGAFLFWHGHGERTGRHG